MAHYRRLPLRKLYNWPAEPGRLSHRRRQGHPVPGPPALRGPLRPGADANLEFLLDYGVTGTADLRSQGERMARPRAGRPGERLPPLPDPPLRRLRRRQPCPGGLRLGEQYRRMAEDNPAFFRETLPICLKEPGALLFHCTTGRRLPHRAAQLRAAQHRRGGQGGHRRRLLRQPALPGAGLMSG